VARPALRSKHRKNRGQIDYDYLGKLGDADLDFLEAFTASFYNGAASDRPGSVGQVEANELNSARRRDVFAAFRQVEANYEQLTEYPPHRGDFSEGRRRQRRKRRSAA